MTFGRLLRANLLFHWRANLAVLLGVAVGTAVLTGALLVGDSLRGSLRALALERLGWIDQVMIGSRFIPTSAARDLPADRVAPAILLRGSARDASGDRLVRQVTVLGVDHRFWSADADRFWDGATDEVVLNRPLADALHVHPGEMVRLQFPKVSDVPRESLLGRRKTEDVIDELQLRVRAVLPDGAFGAAFSLQPGTDTPRNAFVPLRVLQKQLRQPDRANVLLVGSGRPELQETFRARLEPEDWGLKLISPRDRVDALFARLDRNRDGKLVGREWYEKRGDRRVSKFAGALGAAIPHADSDVYTYPEVVDYFQRHYPYLSLESQQLLIEPALADTALAAARDKDVHLTAAPTLVYLANTISDGKNEIPYSLVAAVNPALSPPLGPFLPPGAAGLKDDEIALVDWKDSPLRDTVAGTRITLKYYRPEEFGEHGETSAEFKLAGPGRVALTGAALDPYLTPELPGVTDQISLQSWDPPFHYDRSRIKPDDINERYWEDYRTTPKAYVTLAGGQKLWGSRFGKLTSIRLAPREGRDLKAATEAFRTALKKRLDAQAAGLVFQDVKSRSLGASSGGTDFAPLFLGFSFFLIAAALLLVALLFRLNLERRASEIGLLLSVGYRPSTVRWLLLAEGTVISLLGVALGLASALGYAALVLKFLGAVWPGGVLHSFLRPHFEQSALSLLIGGGASLLVSLLTIAWALRGMARIPPRTLLGGQTAGDAPSVPGRVKWSWWIAGVSFIGAIVLIVVAPMVRDPEARAGSFFGSGALLLTAALAAISGWMRSSRHRTVEGHGFWSVARLGIRNAARHPARSLLTVGLLASAAFLLVAVEAFRRHADFNPSEKHFGAGGFLLIGESDVPVFQDLNDRKKVHPELLQKAEERWRDQLKTDNPEQTIRERRDKAKQLLDEVVIVSLRVKSGDDASCLNLYQPTRPRLFGVPDRLIDWDGFDVTTTEPKGSNPWQLLLKTEDDDRTPGGPPLPAFGENNTVVWMLKKNLGGLVEVPSQQTVPEPSPTRQLRLVGLLQDSVFQSGLLVSEKNFLTLYPGHEGYTFFLIRCPAGREADVKELLETALSDHGFEVTRSTDRLEEYLAVENTYLTTFQALGGLGLLLGSLGLAVVLLRGVWERRGELALLRALGWRRRTLAWLVLAENGFLLLLGLAAGTLAAAAAVAPHLTAGGGVPWARLLGLLGLVLVVGLASAALAVASTVRAPLVPALRRE
jgi:ABC-type antimicrobial peptide transport system permease subunit